MHWLVDAFLFAGSLAAVLCALILLEGLNKLWALPLTLFLGLYPVVTELLE